MWTTTTAMIRRHIKTIPQGAPFSTREFLAYGLRATIDQALYRMVKDCEIIRLARGIFVRPRPGQALPCARAVAETKAKAFGKQLLIYGQNAAYQLGLLTENQEQTFAVLGKTSSFQFGTTRIIFKGISAKKACLQNETLGLALRALHHLATKDNVQEQLMNIRRNLNRIQKADFHRSAKFMPAWISDALYSLHPNIWWGKHLQIIPDST